MLLEHLKQMFLQLASESHKTNPHIPIQIPLSYGAKWLKEYYLTDYSIDDIQQLINHCNKIDAKGDN